jgi:hypothetical protein
MLDVVTKLEIEETESLLDVQMQGANYCDDGFIADIHNSAKVWLSYT